MNRLNMSKRAKIVEAIIIAIMLIYISLQIIYGIRYHIPPLSFIINIMAVVVVYGLESYLYVYPWKMNRLSEEECVGNVRKYSLHLIQAIKFVFNAGLLVPCIFDIKGIELKEGFSVILIFLLIIIAVCYEWKIFQELRSK